MDFGHRGSVHSKTFDAMGDLQELTEAFTGVGRVSVAWVLMAMVIMPAGPTAGLSGMSEGQQKWGNRIFGNMQAPMRQSVCLF